MKLGLKGMHMEAEFGQDKGMCADECADVKDNPAAGLLALGRIAAEEILIERVRSSTWQEEDVSMDE